MAQSPPNGARLAPGAAAERLAQYQDPSSPLNPAERMRRALEAPTGKDINPPIDNPPPPMMENVSPGDGPMTPSKARAAAARKGQ